MLRKISVRNAKRQFKDYALYLITLVCSVSFMYAFNNLVFSESLKRLSELEILPYFVIAASVLIILVLGWIVSYMTNYMLKKRSKELSVYMVLGVPGKSINKLLFFENFMIGGIAFAIGVLVGLLLAQLLEAALLNIFGLEYHLGFVVSIQTLGLTFLYFAAIFLFALIRNGKWIRKTKLYDLLYFDRQHDKKMISGKATGLASFVGSALVGLAGIGVMVHKPIGDGYDTLVGLLFLVLFLFGFFISIPALLTMRLDKRDAWKYSKNRLVVFRAFTSKLQSMSIVMGVLSIVFMLAITLMGTGIGVNMIANRSIDLNVFDILILHQGAEPDFSAYNKGIGELADVRASHSYEIYTDSSNTFHTIRDRVVEQVGRPALQYTEFLNDTYMLQSDYQELRNMLGYEPVALAKNCYYLHCVPVLKESFEDYGAVHSTSKIAGSTLAAGDIFTEPFSQADAYGNGQDYIVIVPDAAVNHLKVLYSLYAVTTDTPLSSDDLQSLTEQYSNVAMLDRNTVTYSPGSMAGIGTALREAGTDYIQGKWAQKETLAQLYSLLVCFFYLALILEITGAAVLATQVLGDSDKKKRQNQILRQLGMRERQITKLGNRQLALLFTFPIIPALIISVILVFASLQAMQLDTYSLPIFNGGLWTIQAIGITLLLFASLYGLYYIGARISQKRQA